MIEQTVVDGIQTLLGIDGNHLLLPGFAGGHRGVPEQRLRRTRGSALALRRARGGRVPYARAPVGDPDQAAIIAFADAHPDKQDAALGGFIDVLAKLRWGTIERVDIDGTRAKAAESLREPDAEAHRLPSAAFNVLIGSPVPELAQILREVEAVTAQDVQAVAEQAFTAGLLMAPDGRRADWAGFVTAPTSSDEIVSGVRYPMRGDSDHALVVGAGGVSMTDPGGGATVHFAQCAAMLSFADGGRLLIGNDGITCRVEPRGPAGGRAPP